MIGHFFPDIRRFRATLVLLKSTLPGDCQSHPLHSTEGVLKAVKPECVNILLCIKKQSPFYRTSSGTADTGTSLVGVVVFWRKIASLSPLWISFANQGASGCFLRKPVRAVLLLTLWSEKMRRLCLCHKYPRFTHHLFCVPMSCTAKGGFSKKAQNPHCESNPAPLSDWWKGEFAHSFTITLCKEKQKHVNYSIPTTGKNYLYSILYTECDHFSKHVSVLAYEIWHY